MQKIKVGHLFTALFIVFTMCSLAHAGSSGSEFDSLWQYLLGIVQGTFGRVVALSAVAVGALMSVARANPIPALSGIAFAIFEFYTPTVIQGILSGLL